MDLQLQSPLGEYLKASDLVDVDHAAIQAQAAALKTASTDEIDFARRAYEFVRDEIAHSWDLQSRRVTAKASDVLEYREGICYAKSHLLAALLRAEGVPSGIGYQRLTLFDDPRDGYCLHALNNVYLKPLDRWIRVDARGNKPGVDARFMVDGEQLAFSIRTELGEIDYPDNFAAPPECIVDTLLGNTDCMVMYQNGLPTDLDR